MSSVGIPPGSMGGEGGGAAPDVGGFVSLMPGFVLRFDLVSIVTDRANGNKQNEATGRNS